MSTLVLGTHSFSTTPDVNGQLVLINTSLGGVGDFSAAVTGSRPAFGNAGNIFIDTTLNIIQRDTGSAWVTLGSGGGGTPGGSTTNIQYNNAGVFGGSSAFNFVSGTNPYVTLTGTVATNQFRVGGFTAPEASGATIYIETSNANQDGQLIYFNSGTSTTSGYISYAYDASTPYLRLTDADDDPPYIAFNTIGTGTYAAPLYVSGFGARGNYGSRTAGNNSGFAWYVGANTTVNALISAGSAVMELDSQWLRIPSGTTAQRPTGVVGMTRFNTSVGSDEVYVSGGSWAQRVGVIDKSVVTQAVTTNAATNFISYSVPGGTLGTTNLLRIRSAGRWQNTSGATRTVTIVISYGGTTMWQDTSASLANGADLGWNVDLILSSNNSATSQVLNGVIQLGGTGATTTGLTGDLASATLIGQAILIGTAAINSGSNQTLAVSTTFNGTGITWTKYFHTIEKL